MMYGVELILKYFPDITAKQKEKFAQLQDIYFYWNERINVISRKDIEELYLRHVLHSLAIAKFVDFKPDTFIIDIGTGGGFPGVPLSIMFPECEFLLVDSIGKKISVVQEAIKAAGIENAEARKARLEEVKLKPHFYVSRAVAPFTDLCKWINGNLDRAQQFNDKPNGLITLKGGDLTSEMKGYRNAEIVPLTTYFEEEFFETKAIAYNPL